MNGMGVNDDRNIRIVKDFAVHITEKILEIRSLAGLQVSSRVFAHFLASMEWADDIGSRLLHGATFLSNLLLVLFVCFV